MADLLEAVDTVGFDAELLQELKEARTSMKKNWRVVWNIFYFCIYWVANHPNSLSNFSEGLKPPTRKCFSLDFLNVFDDF